MIRQPLKAVPAVVFAFLLIGGCSSHPTMDAAPEIDESTPLDEQGNLVETPGAVQQALEKLDAQDEEPAVTLVDGQHVAVEQHNDLFDRIRAGFALSDVDHQAVDNETRWFARHPEYLDRTFRRGERYLYHIVGELEARKMPLELALLPIVESAFNPVAYSRSRASGLWQFIPATGRRYGLKQNWYYDGRRDVLQATRAALDYLQFLSNEFEGDWLLAVAAYNCGEMAVARAINRNQSAGKPTDFFSLKLPRETRAYVPKLLAMRRLVADPAAHGLAFAPIANQPYFAKVELGSQLDLNVAAELADLSKEELLALNPAFNHWVTDPDGPHYLLVPVDREEKLVAALIDLPAEKRVRVVYHRVRRGDTLGAIASRYGVSVSSLRSANGLRGSIIHPGQDLMIASAPRGMALASANITPRAPSATASKGTRHVVRRGDTLWSIARNHNIGINSLASSNGLARGSTLKVGQVLKVPGTARLASTMVEGDEDLQRLTYVVRRGDTLSRIADRFRVRLQDVLGWNNLRSAHFIKPGQRLVMFVDDTRRSGG